MWVKDIITTQKDQRRNKISFRSYQFMHFDRKFSIGTQAQEKVPVGFYISNYENTLKKLFLKVAATLLNASMKGAVRAL